MAMIEYVRKTPDGQIEVGSDGTLGRYEEPLSRYLNRLAYRRLTTFTGAVEAARRQYGIRIRTPIYLGDDVFFLPLCGFRSSGCLLVNHFAIVCVSRTGEGGIVIRFRSGMILLAPSYAILERQRALAERMLACLNDRRER